MKIEGLLTQLLDALYTGTDSVHLKMLCHESLDQIEQENVAPQVLSIVKSQQWLDRLPRDYVEELNRLHQRTVGQNLYIRFHQQQLLSALDAEKIPVIPLKGVLFAERYFGNFASRPTSDIDILLEWDDLERAIACLRSQGFRGPLDYNPLHFHCVMSKRIHPSNAVLNIELHWSLVHQNNASPQWNEFWKTAGALDGYKYVRELTVQDTFYSICLHGANHQLNSFKYLLDVAHLVYTRAPDIDFDRLLETAKRDKTMRRVKAVLTIVYSEFAGLQKHKPLRYWTMGGTSVSKAVLRIPVLMPDVWGLRFRLIKEWFWPLREVAIWHLRDDPGLTSSNVYRRFYRQRLVHLVNKLSPGHRASKEKEIHA